LGEKSTTLVVGVDVGVGVAVGVGAVVGVAVTAGVDVDVTTVVGVGAGVGVATGDAVGPMMRVPLLLLPHPETSSAAGSTNSANKEPIVGCRRTRLRVV